MKAKKIYGSKHPLFIGAVGISFVAIMVIIAFSGITFYLINRQAHIEMAQKESALLAHFLSHEFVERFNEGDDSSTMRFGVVDDEDIALFDSHVKEHSEEADILKVKIFNTAAKIIYSTDKKIIGKLDKENKELARALSGEKSSKWEHKESVFDLDEEERYDRNIVETYIPLYDDAGEIWGVYEVYLDYSGHRASSIKELKSFLFRMTLFLIVVFSVVCLLVYYADSLISKNQRLLHEANVKLEEKVTLRTSEIDEKNKQLQEMVKEWKLTFDSMKDLVSIHDKDFKIIKANKAFADAFGMKPEEINGKICYELVCAVQEPLSNCPHTQTIKTKQPSSAEIFHPVLKMEIEISTSPLVDEKGEVQGTVHVIRDITERKENLKQIEQANKELKEKTEDLEKFHDVTLGRESKMIKLKEEVNSLMERLNLPKKYDEVDRIKESQRE